MRVKNLNLPETTKSTPLKINVDATLHEESGLAAVAWVFKNHVGKCLDISGCNLGKGYKSVQAENHAIKRVLSVLDDYPEVQHVKLYSDCRPALEQLENVDLAGDTFESVTMEWIPRDQNKDADLAADSWIAKQVGRGVGRVGPKFNNITD